ATFPVKAQRVLRAASVFGQVFWAGGVAALLAGEPIVTSEWLEELLHREVIVARRTSKFPGEEEYVFHHDWVRDAAYAMLTDDELHAGHRRAADWLLTAGEMDAAALAEHRTRGGDHVLAAALHLKAAEQALAAHDFAASIEHAKRGVACGVEGEMLGE